MAQYLGNILVLLDLVGTLAKAGSRYAEAFREVCEGRGLPQPSAEELMSVLGEMNLSQITDRFLGPLKDDDKKAFMADCNVTCDALLYRPSQQESLFEGAGQAVEAMHARGVTLGIFTGTRREALDAQIDYHGIRAFFDARYLEGKDSVRDAEKSSVDLKRDQLGRSAATFRAENGENALVIVFGDSPADVKAASELGLAFVGFAVNEKKKILLEQAGAKVIFTNFSDLQDFVEQHMPGSPANDCAPCRSSREPVFTPLKR